MIYRNHPLTLIESGQVRVPGVLHPFADLERAQESIDWEIMEQRAAVASWRQ